MNIFTRWGSWIKSWFVPEPPPRSLTPEEQAEFERLFGPGNRMLQAAGAYLLAEINKPKPGRQPPKPRFPYFHAGINMEIRDQAEEDALNEGLAMDYTDLVQFKDEHELSIAMGYPHLNERWYHVRMRAARLQAYELKSRGELRPPVDITDLVAGWVVGTIITDEYFKRLGKS